MSTRSLKLNQRHVEAEAGLFFIFPQERYRKLRERSKVLRLQDDHFTRNLVNQRTFFVRVTWFRVFDNVLRLKAVWELEHVYLSSETNAR